MRTLFGLFSLVVGSLLGGLGGLAVYRWVHGVDEVSCGDLFSSGSSCGGRPSDGPYLVVGALVGVVLVALWTWWMQRPSTRG